MTIHQQEWKGMDGAIAWQLIERHADDWPEIIATMNAWLKANVDAEREECAKLCEGIDAINSRGWGDVLAKLIRARGEK